MPLLPSSATLVSKADQNGLKQLLTTLESLLSIFLLIFTQFPTWKRHASSNQYMSQSTIIDATRLFPNPVYTKASNLFRPETASVSTLQGRSSCMDTVQDHPKLIKPTCKHKKNSTDTCEESMCFFGSHLFSWRFSHTNKLSLSALFIVFTQCKNINLSFILLALE